MKWPRPCYALCCHPLLVDGGKKRKRFHRNWRLVYSSPRVAYVRDTETPELRRTRNRLENRTRGLGRNSFHGRKGRPWKSVERRANANLAHVGAFPYSFADFWNEVNRPAMLRYTYSPCTVPAGFHFRTNEVFTEHPSQVFAQLCLLTGTKRTDLAMTSQATAVIAVPCDMPEGYVFTAVVDGRQLPGE
jgi:hypothetical protein